MSESKSAGQNWVKFDETDDTIVSRVPQLKLDPRRLNEDKYVAFAKLDKSAEPKGWSENIQPMSVLGWSKEILQGNQN